MRHVSESLLLSGQTHPVVSRIPVSGEGIILQRIQAARGAQEVVWSILVEKCTGAPSTGYLYAALQGGFPTTKGAETPPTGVGTGVGGNYYMTEVANQWFTLNDDDHAGFLPDGSLPTLIADHTISTATLSATTTLGDRTVRLSRRFPVGTTLNIGTEQLYVVGAPTTADSGATWTHPVISAGGPHGTGDSTDTTALSTAAIAKAHASGDIVHAPRAHFKRVLGGFDQRLVLTPTFSGGTSPAFYVTVHVRARG